MKKRQMDNNAVNKLATAIMAQAVRDYIKALIDEDEKRIIECEIFFTGGVAQDDWFEILSDCADPDKVIERAKRKAKMFKDEAKRHQPESLDDIKHEDTRQRCSFKCPVCGDGTARWTSISKKNSGIWINHKCDNCGVSVVTLWRGEHASDK